MSKIALTIKAAESDSESLVSSLLSLSNTETRYTSRIQAFQQAGLKKPEFKYKTLKQDTRQGYKLSNEPG